MLRIITDSASDITVEQAQAMKIDVIPLEITFDDGPCPQKTEADFAHFYERLRTCDTLPITSRPAPQAYLEIYLDAKSKGDEVLVLTVSSGLSGTIETAVVAQKLAEYDAIYIVDTHQAILTQRMLVEHAVAMRNQGFGAKEIAEEIKSIRDEMVVCGVVGTLRYLQKGGRIPSSLALLGQMMNIKPVIVLEDKILKQLGKARGYTAGMAMLHKRMEEDEYDFQHPVLFGYTSDKQLGEQLMHKTCDKFGINNTMLYPVGGIIGTQCGTDCMAVAYRKKSSKSRTV